MTYNVIFVNFSLINEKSDGGKRIKILCYIGRGFIKSFLNIVQIFTDFANGTLTIKGYQFTEQDIGGQIPGNMGQNHTLLLQFCCREDGNHLTPIQLPKEFPFIMFQVHAFLFLNTKDCNIKRLLLTENYFKDV